MAKTCVIVPDQFGMGVLAISHDLMIAGPGADRITVSGNHASRVFNIAAQFTVALSGLTIADGKASSSSGGGIDNAGTLTVTDSTFSGNSAQYWGGGIHNTGSDTLTVTDSTFRGNSAYNGGGIHNTGTGTLTLTACIFSGNSATLDGGGGIWSSIGTVIVAACTFRGNSAGTGRGGGILSDQVPARGTVIITASTFSDNSASFGGGINNLGTLTVTASTFRGNSAVDGAGINNDGSSNGNATATVIDSTFSNNSAATYGGGIENGGTLTVTASTFRGNSAGYGAGGIFNLDSGPVMVTASTFRGNSARNGGGIYNFGSRGTLTIVDSTFSGNSATFDSGGGIWSSIGTVIIAACTFRGNSAGTGRGGGIYNLGPQATLTVVDSTFRGNSARDGGGIDNAGTLTATSSTLSGNSATGSGGGILNSDSSSTIALRNTIAAGNTAGGGPDLSGSVNSLGHNLVGDSGGAIGFADTDLLNVDPRLGPLADNGGPTQTMALLAGSPAIDAGDPTDAPEWDQRGPGYPRVINGKIDIGAFEHQPAAPAVTCMVADSLLWPPNHRLVNVGLSVTIDPPDATLQVQVYANDHARPSDAQDIGPDTLQLRSERQGNGDGRVYLIVVTAANAGGTSFDVCTVAVPHDHSPRSLAAAQQQAAAADAYYRQYQTAPPRYHLLGDGPGGGSGAPSPGQSGEGSIPGDIFQLAAALPITCPSPLGPASATAEAFRLPDAMRGAWAELPVENYLATASNEGFRLLAARPAPTWQDAITGAVLDLWPGDDRLLV